MSVTPEMVAAAWHAWHSRHGGKLGPGPAFVEAIQAALTAQKQEPLCWLDAQEVQYISMVTGNKAWQSFTRSVRVGGESEGRLPLYTIQQPPAVTVKSLEKLPAAFEVLDTDNGTYLTRSEQAAISSEYSYNGLYRRDGFTISDPCQALENNANPEGFPVTLTYTNYRGETSERTIVPKRIWFGATEWHPEPQWLLTDFDFEKGADRDFALKDFGGQSIKASYQDRVTGAHHALFHDDPTDIPERNARAFEESIETAQAFGMPHAEAIELVNYTFSRPVGDPKKEIGASILTAFSLGIVAGFDVMEAAEAELSKMQQPETIARIRAKRATRHGRGPLPGLDPAPVQTEVKADDNH